MYIVKVSPLTKGTKTEYLSYFSLNPVETGAIVNVTLRNKKVKAIVIESTSANQAKTEIKTQGFKLKKINSISGKSLSGAFIKTAKSTADYFATSSGSVINALLPKNISENIVKSLDKKEEPAEAKEDEDVDLSKSVPKFIIQENDDDRYSHYRSLIREQFARRKSVLFCVPHIEDIEPAKDRLKKGIEQYVFSLNSKMTEKDASKVLGEIAKAVKPILVVVTPSYPTIPMNNLGTIVIEKENSPAYKTYTRPFIDFRIVAEIYAKEIRAQIIFGDQILRATTLGRYDEHELLEYTPIKFRSIGTTDADLIHMNEEKDGLFKIFSDSLDKMIRAAKNNNDSVFLYAARKGLSPSIVCQDCGQTVVCPECDIPLVLYGKDATEPKNFLLCHRCGHKESAGKLCANCNSWRLKTLGVGIEMITNHLKKEFKDMNIFTLDKTTAKTPEKARAIAEKFYNTPGSVLVGTEMALLYLREPVASTAVVSIDSLFSIPDYRIKERILNILLRVRSLAQKKFIIQTRKVGDKIFEYAIGGNIADFFREEFKERSRFSFPPFSLMIKISLTGKADAVKAYMQRLSDLLHEEEMIVFPAFQPKAKGLYTMHGILRIDRKRWVDNALLTKLRSLPPQFRIEIDADSIL